MMRKQFFICGMCFLISFFAKAQDVHFSQFNMAPLLQNPAMAGAVYDMEGIVNYKDQWQSIGTPFRTMGASFDMKLAKKKAQNGFWAAGMNFFSDHAGDSHMGTTQANLSVAYHIFMAKYSALGAGIQVGYAQRSILYDDLSWGNQFDGSFYDSHLPNGEPAGSTAFSYPDFGAGLVYHYNNTAGKRIVTDNHDLQFTAGAAVFHPQRPRYGFYDASERLYPKFVVHARGIISVPNSNLAFIPGLMYYRQGPAQEIFIGTLLRYRLKQDSKYTGFEKGAAISLGAFYRTRDALAVTALMEYANYSIGMSYDVNTSKLRAASNMRGGIEITLRFVSPNPFLYKQFYRQISNPMYN